jgi:hypothetical protein
VPARFDPRLEVLPPSQREVWAQLAPAPGLSFVLYGGTAVALQLGHRQSVDFDFFRAEPLDKDELRRAFAFMPSADVIQDAPETLVVLAHVPSGAVKVSFFGRLALGRLNDPLLTRDGILLVASLEDLMATKLKATLDRAEARDYRDIAEMLSAGVSLSRSLAAFKQMFPRGEPAEVLRAIGYFDDGDLDSLTEADRSALRRARDGVKDLPRVKLRSGSLAVPPEESE